MLAISSFRGSTARAMETLVSCRMLLRRSFKSAFVTIEAEIACSCARTGSVAPPELALAPE
eukprot:10972291-Alexandrium_andersonii.AAC.1